MKVTLKKSSKKVLSKKSDKEKATLEATRGSELTQSFLERFDNLRIRASSGAAKILIEKSIYSKEDQIKSE
ncbi:41828_t:CDS:2, partial [Gigaspora margarita]